MRAAGSYALLMRLGEDRVQRVGRLGRFCLRAGWYLYVGSACGPGGLAGRLAHHLRPVRRPHWHIDYLRHLAELRAILVIPGRERQECAWAAAAAATPGACIPVRRFGASDCRCAGHLIYWPQEPPLGLLASLLPGISILPLSPGGALSVAVPPPAPQPHPHPADGQQRQKLRPGDKAFDQRYGLQPAQSQPPQDEPDEGCAQEIEP